MNDTKYIKRKVIIAGIAFLAILGIAILAGSLSKNTQSDGTPYESRIEKIKTYIAVSTDEYRIRYIPYRNESSKVSPDTLKYVKEMDGLMLGNFGNYQANGIADGGIVQAEALCGIRMSTQGTQVVVTPYNHVDMCKALKGLSLIGASEGSCLKLDAKGFDEPVVVDMKDSSDGVYYVHAVFEIHDDYYSVNGYFLKDGNDISTCQTFPSFSPEAVDKGISTFHKWTDNLNPNDYLSLDKLTYPSAGGDLGFVDNVDEIAQFSIDNFSDPDWNDEYRVYMMVDWLNRNIAYDKWRTEVNGGESRAHTLDNYSDPSIFCWQSKVGVCWDYTNILAIFCRAQGIPATSMDTSKHTWNIIYLNDRWISIDVCDTGRYDSKTYDGDREQWYGNSGRTWKTYAVLPDLSVISQVESVNDQMWTRKRALGE